MEKIGTIAGRGLVSRGSQQSSGANALAIRRSSPMPAIRNRTTDIDLPRQLWEAWIEPGKPRLLRRPIRDDERSALEGRRDELAPWVCGYAAEERDQAAEAILMMFSGFRSMAGQSDEQAVATVAGVLQSLQPFPVWAIKRACEEIRSRGYTRKDGDRYVTERHWPPSDADLVEAVEAKVKLLRDQHDSAVALLKAEVAK